MVDASTLTLGQNRSSFLTQREPADLRMTTGNEIGSRNKQTVFSSYVAEQQTSAEHQIDLSEAHLANGPVNMQTQEANSLSKQLRLELDLSHVMARSFKPGFPAAFQQHLNAKRVSTTSIKKLNERFRAVSLRTRSNTMYSGSGLGSTKTNQNNSMLNQFRTVSTKPSRQPNAHKKGGQSPPKLETQPTMMMTTPWTRFRAENTTISSIFSPVNTTAFDQTNFSRPNQDQAETVSAFQGASLSQQFRQANKPGTAPGTTRAHKRVNVVLQQHDGVTVQSQVQVTPQASTEEPPSATQNARSSAMYANQGFHSTRSSTAANSGHYESRRRRLSNSQANTNKATKKPQEQIVSSSHTIAHSNLSGQQHVRQKKTVTQPDETNVINIAHFLSGKQKVDQTASNSIKAHSQRAAEVQSRNPSERQSPSNLTSNHFAKSRPVQASSVRDSKLSTQQQEGSLDKDPFLKTQLNLLAGQESRMKALVKRVEHSQKQTQMLLDSIEREEEAMQGKIAKPMRQAEIQEGKMTAHRQMFDQERQLINPKSELEIVQENKVAQNEQPDPSSLMSKMTDQVSLDETQQTITGTQDKDQRSSGLTNQEDTLDREVQQIKSNLEESKRYRQFVSDAHNAKAKSQTMVNRLMEHSRKHGDKKAVTTLQSKQLLTQLVWKDKKNPYYQQNQIFQNFFDNDQQAAEAPEVTERQSSRRSLLMGNSMRDLKSQQTQRTMKKKPPTDQILTKDTLKPLVSIIKESAKANQIMNQQNTILQDGKQKNLPFTQERMISRIHKNLSGCEYDASGLNKDWLSAMSVEQRSLLKKFFRDSGPQFCSLQDYWVEEFCRRIQAVNVPPGVVLKKKGKEADKLYILIKGKVSVQAPIFNSNKTILLNDYYPGQSFCDPVLNETAYADASVSVTSNQPAIMFCLTKGAYVQIYIDKLNELTQLRHKEIKESFTPFNLWDDMRLKNLLVSCKERVLCKDECLIREQQAQPYIYMLMRGKLRVERQVNVESRNYWPVDHNKNWIEKRVTNDVLFKICDICPFKMFGERECIYEYANPVQIVAAAPNTRLILIPRKELMKTLSSKEVERMLIMAQIMFPSETEVKQEVEVVKQVQRIKKNSFMNGVNMNQVARDMRPELLDTKAQKIRFWIDDVDVKVKKRLEERVKIIPKIVPYRSQTPQKESPTKVGPRVKLTTERLNESTENAMSIDQSPMVPFGEANEGEMNLANQSDSKVGKVLSIHEQMEQELVLQEQEHSSKLEELLMSDEKSVIRQDKKSKLMKSMRDISKQAEEQRAEINPKKMHEHSLFDQNLEDKKALTGKDLPQMIKSHDTNFKKNAQLASLRQSHDSQADSGSPNPYSILKSSNLWKKKSGTEIVAQEIKSTMHVPINVIRVQQDKDSATMDGSGLPSPVASDEDEPQGRKQYCEIDTSTIDRFGYKRAYSNKKKLKYEAEVASRILASLAKEASGQETNQ